MSESNSLRSSEYHPAEIDMDDVKDQKAQSPRSATSANGLEETLTPRSIIALTEKRPRFDSHTEETKGTTTSKLMDDPDALLEVSTNLFQVNPFNKAIQRTTKTSLRTKIQQHHDGRGEEVLMLEITDRGDESFRHIRLRDLLEYVNDMAHKIDAAGDGYGVGKHRRDLSSRGTSTRG